MQIATLSNTVQRYDWGSPELIPEYLGIRNPDGTPMAELWMGAHPKSPSRLILGDDRRSLAAEIAEHPEEMLGLTVRSRFGSRLPYLFKVLAAKRGLSIQAHPNKEQAQAGFAREEAAGIPTSAPNRSYRDDNHKPEIICALSEFWALRGFRPVGEIAEEFADPRFDLLRTAVESLHRDGEVALPAFFETIMRSEGEERHSLIASAIEYARSRSAPTGRYGWVLELHRQFGEDIGVLSPLYLNCVKLAPNEALFLPAGVLHAYLSGIGVELMANSDNVLRGGCTSKHVDVDELLSVLTFEAARPEILTGTETSPIEVTYETEAPEFRLSRVSLDGSVPRALETAGGPEILLCTDGNLVVTDDSAGEVTVQRGESFFVPAAIHRLSLRGRGVLYRARVPL